MPRVSLTDFYRPVVWNNGPFAASSHMVHAGGQAAHSDIRKQKKIQIFLDEVALFWMSQWAACPVQHVPCDR